MKNKRLILGALTLVLIICLSSVVMYSADDNENNITELTLGSSVSKSSITPTEYSSASISVSGATVTIRVTDSGYGSAKDDIYKINWGDGTSRAELNSSNNASKSHTYSSNGTYTVSLTIETWKDGADLLATTSDSFTVTVNSYSSSTNYTVKFNLNGGHIVSGISISRTVASGTTITLPGMGDVEKDDAYLTGWALNSSSGTNYPTLGSYTVRSSVTFYALWSTSTYSAIFFPNGGICEHPTTSIPPHFYSMKADFGDSITLPSDGFTKEGYFLSGWNTKADGSGTSYDLGSSLSMPSGGIHLYAQYSLPVITFDTEETVDYVSSDIGDLVVTDNMLSVQAGTRIVLPSMSPKLVDGWIQIVTNWRDNAGNSLDLDYTVSKSLTISPVYTNYIRVNVVDPAATVEFNSYFSSYFSHDIDWGDGHSITVDSITSPNLTHEYLVNSSYAVTVQSHYLDTSVNATYTIQISNSVNDITAYTVIFETSGGSEIQPQIIPEGSKAVKPIDPVKSGYNFIGWYSDSDYSTVFDFETVIKSDITVYAKWVDKSLFSVIFETNGGSEIDTRYVEKDTKISKPDDPQKDGYKFAGWYVNKDCTVAFDFDTPISENFTLYAKWTADGSSGGSNIWSWLLVIIVVICALYYFLGRDGK